MSSPSKTKKLSEAKELKTSEETTRKRKNLKKSKSQPHVPRIDTLKSSAKKDPNKKKTKTKVKRPKTPKSKPPSKPLRESKSKKSENGSTPRKESESNLLSPRSESTDQLEKWFKELGLEEFASVIKTEMLDMETFLLLNESDLKGMNIPLGPRKKMLNAIQSKSGKKESLTSSSAGSSTTPDSSKAASSVTTASESQPTEKTETMVTEEERPKAICTSEFEGDPSENLLSLKKGEVVYVIEKHVSGWWWGETVESKTKGYFPGSHVKMAPRVELGIHEAEAGEKKRKAMRLKAMKVSLSAEDAKKPSRLNRLSAGATNPLQKSEPGQVNGTLTSTNNADSQAAIPPRRGRSLSGNGLVSLNTLKKAGAVSIKPNDAVVTRRPAEETDKT